MNSDRPISHTTAMHKVLTILSALYCGEQAGPGLAFVEHLPQCLGFVQMALHPFHFMLLQAM